MFLLRSFVWGFQGPKHKHTFNVCFMFACGFATIKFKSSLYHSLFASLHFCASKYCGMFLCVCAFH